MNQQASKKKRFNARFPPARIKKIMQLDEDVGKVAAAVPVLISRALENFVESFLKKTAEVTTIRQSRTLTPLHVKQCINADKRFAFLKDIVANVSDIQTEEEGGPSQPNTPLTPQPPGHKPFQFVRGSSVDTANLAKAKGTRRPLAVKSKSVPPPRRGLKSTTDSEEEELTPEFESDDDEDDDTDSSQGSRKRPKLSQSSSTESLQRPTFTTSGPHLPPGYCSVIKGPVNPLPHPYSFMSSKAVSAAFLTEPRPAHLQPPVPALPLKTPLPAHLSTSQTFPERGVLQPTAVTVNVDGAQQRGVLQPTAVTVNVDGTQPFHIEVTLPGDNNGVKKNGVSSVAISKVSCEVDDDYDA